MIKLTCSIFMSSSNFFIIFFTYIKTSKDSSAKYYQNNKERLGKKKIAKDISLSKEKIERKSLYGGERYKNLQQDEKQKLFRVKEKI